MGGETCAASAELKDYVQKAFDEDKQVRKELQKVGSINSDRTVRKNDHLLATLVKSNILVFVRVVDAFAAFKLMSNM